MMCVVSTNASVVAPRKRGNLTAEEWSLIEPHLPLGERGPIPDLRQQFNAVMWRFRTGSPWRDLPAAEYGPWSTVYDTGSAWTPPRPALITMLLGWR
jgi:transposase